MVSAKIRTAPIIVLALVGVALAGCVEPGAEIVNVDEYVIAFSVKDDYQAFVTNTKPLADFIAAQTGVPTRILPVEDDSVSIGALATGQAHAAFMDGGGAWIGWTKFGLQAIAADAQADGTTSYVALAYVLRDSGIGTVADFKGKRSCHTGETGSAGMLMPMGYLIGQGHVDMSGLDLKDIASLHKARERHFSASAIGGGYAGAFQCLSTGQGDIAFVKESTWQDSCGGESPAPWCRPPDAYRMLPAGGFANVPSHPVMVPGNLAASHKDALRAAILALNDSEEGRAILKDILNTPAITAVDTEEHLGSYGAALEHIPGIESLMEKKQRA